MPSPFCPLIGIITGKSEMMARKRKKPRRSRCSNDGDFRLRGRRFWRDENDGDSVLMTESWQVCSTCTPMCWRKRCACFACESWWLWFFCQPVHCACVKMTSHVGKHETSYIKKERLETLCAMESYLPISNRHAASWFFSDGPRQQLGVVKLRYNALKLFF